ncbi:hypothetical protein NKI56_17045 [Mesorhizobium sp. M0622]|uniref:hypothetical protein n=1 Tax=unclassified Mesorhizobium TaxID=325217 RepID=UPI0033380F82
MTIQAADEKPECLLPDCPLLRGASKVSKWRCLFVPIDETMGNIHPSRPFAAAD